MLQSQLFTKTRKQAPADEVAKNAQLLIRAGFITKEMAGVYAFLPLGLKVQKKIEKIIRGIMEKDLEAQEILLSTLQDPETWKKTNRWKKDIDIWFTTELRGKEVGLGLSHEEPLTKYLSKFVGSYQDLPFYTFQIQNKFRNEPRASSGLIRAREFLMKDLYSFTLDSEQLDTYYEKVAEAYKKIFSTVGLGDRTFRTFASGGDFSEFSDEFQTLCGTGEDTIYLSKDKSIAINKEVFNTETLSKLLNSTNKLDLTEKDFDEVRAVEVGNIFKLGTRFSEKLDLFFTDKQGKQHPVFMGSYGIGLGRLMGTVAEVLSDDKGLVWPKSVAPFDVHVVELNPKGDATVKASAEDLVKQLEQHGQEVLHDDRAELSAGQKFADSDLIGIPTRIVVSEKTVTAKKFEVIDRASGSVEYQTAQEISK